VACCEVIPLRHKLLRQGKPIETCFFDNDEAQFSRHFGVLLKGVKKTGDPQKNLLAIASLYRVNLPGDNKCDAWQLRGMATDIPFRRQGIAITLLHHCIEYVRNQGGEMIWCNARIESVRLYQRSGFDVLGEEFDIPGIGKHFRMSCSL